MKTTLIDQSENFTYHRVVVKLGTTTLTAGTSRLSAPRLVDLAKQVAELRQMGTEVILVSSGAIAAGRERLGLQLVSDDLPAKQMLAAVGQLRLMALYEKIFDLYGLIVAQVLLTRADINDRRRYLNSRNTLKALLHQGVIPVINENDTVATEEIRVGDNDNLSALVSNLVEADLLVLLTDQDGLFTSDPRHDPEAKLVSVVGREAITAEYWKMAGGSDNLLGTGGMVTKLQAADLARRGGTTVVIANGNDLGILPRLLKGNLDGTWFLPLMTHLDSRKRYLLAGGRNTAKLVVDDGAVQALSNGSSLLPVGILKIDGKFNRGNSVTIVDTSGKEIARGLVNYPGTDLVKIIGLKSEQIASVLGYDYGAEVIHRDNLVLLQVM
jgi:glutamate 5-kinase